MKQTEIDYLDGEFQVTEEEPSTIQECIDLIGESATVDETTSNLRYRNKYPRVYKLVSKAIEERGFARPVKEEKTLKDGTVKKVYVSEMDHIRAALKGVKDDQGNVTLAPLENGQVVIFDLFNTIAPAQPLYVKGERSGGGGKVSQAAMESANGFFAAGDEVVEEKITTIESMVPGFKVGRDGDGNPTPESLARGIMALQRHLQKQAQKDALNALGGAAAA